MNFYSFEEVRAQGNCITFAESLGAKVRDGRCAAVWRGGDGQNVAVNEKDWYDHKAKQGGGILELCMVAKFPGDIQAAQNYLGEWLRLAPKRKLQKSPSSHSRYDDLITQGYREVTRYNYVDQDGSVRHFVCRMHHPEKGKEFIQGTPHGWGLRDVTPILYRLADWKSKPTVCVVEGEKDADTLIDRLGMPATTNCGGAEKWRSEYAELFRGKNVVILRDNDEAGEKHALRVAHELHPVAKRLAIVCLSKLPKGDVTDWLEQEGGTREALVEAMKAAPLVDPAKLTPVDPVVELAKEANKTTFANFTEEKIELPTGGFKINRVSRQIIPLIDEVHKRFCGFPRRIGDSKYMFDHDRDTGRITHIHNPNDLFAWMGRKSKCKIAWTEKGDAMVSKGELFHGLVSAAKSYEAISAVPDWPRREDVYYYHPRLPDPSPGFQHFNDLIEFFNPASEAYRTLLKAFVCAPLWYEHGIPRPGWIIDSVDGAGVGKTTLVEIVARLYGTTTIKTNKQELRTDVSKLIKRIVSTAGRTSRILLVDNVTGEFHCSELSDFMTSESISGIAPYGRGEETRPNNLTYVITANSATVDNDLSDRCYFVQLCKPGRSGAWKREILDHIERNRFAIIADIIGLLESRKGEPFESAPRTRFPEFEETILRGVCEDEEEYAEALAVLSAAKAASNSEDEDARIIVDEFRSRLVEAGRYPSSEQIWIQSAVLKLWLTEILERRDINASQYLRNLAKNGLLTCFNHRVEIYPHNGANRRRGIMWMPDRHDGGSPRIIGLKGRRVCEV